MKSCELLELLRINNFLGFENMKLMTKNKLIITLALIFFILGAVVFSFFSVKARDESVESDNIKTVKIKTVELEDFQASIEYSGFIQGEKQVMLAPKINGRILSVLKSDGDTVKKGEIIAILSADEIKAQSSTAQQTIEALNENLSQTERYYKQKVSEAKDNKATSEEVQSAKRLRDLQVKLVEKEIIRARGGLGEVQSLIKETIVRAPFDGVITKFVGEIGQLVGPTVPVCEIADDKNIVAEVFVNRDVLLQIHKGQKVKAFCGDNKKECFGEVKSVGAISESNAQKGLVRVIFEKNNPEVYLGQYVILQLPNSKDDKKIILDEKLIISRYDETFVFILENDFASERKVKLGKFQDGKVEVLEGISLGEKIITDGLNKIRNNEKVKIYE